MKKRAILVAFLFLTLVLPGLSQAGTPGKAKPAAGPSLVISHPTFEAGKVLEGNEIVHTFILQNKGTKDLVIKNVKPG